MTGRLNRRRVVVPIPGEIRYSLTREQTQAIIVHKQNKKKKEKKKQYYNTSLH